MTKHFISVDIVHHRLASMPHVMTVDGSPSDRAALPRAIEPVRGIAAAAILSGLLWALLIATIV